MYVSNDRKFTYLLTYCVHGIQKAADAIGVSTP